MLCYKLQFVEVGDHTLVFLYSPNQRKKTKKKTGISFKVNGNERRDEEGGVGKKKQQIPNLIRIQMAL